MKNIIEEAYERNMQAELRAAQREAVLNALAEHRKELTIGMLLTMLTNKKEMLAAVQDVGLEELGQKLCRKKTICGNGAAVGDAVVNSLKGNSGKAMTAEQVAAEVGKSVECSPSGVRGQLKKLVDAGLVTHDGKPRGRRYSSVTGGQ